jgi:DNA-binding NarL/FixJ family response regulator
MNNLLIADDHRFVLDGIKAMLTDNTNFRVTQEAINGQSAWQLLQKHHSTIDIVLTDMNMPEMDGITLIRNIKRDYPHIKVLVITMYNSPQLVRDLLDVEAEGYILKDTGRRELLEALQRLIEGKTYFANEVINTYFVQQERDRKAQNALATFTEREMEVLRLILTEKNSDEIGKALFISKRTVDVHRQHILEKSGCKTIVGLLKFAYTNGLLD